MVFLAILSMKPDKIAAANSETCDAYEYYARYGNRMVFFPENQADGRILCATKAKKSTSSIRFKTLGWKATIYDSYGKNLQTLYFQLGGRYMSRIHTCVRGGYEYNLYSLSLQSLKGRLSDGAVIHLQSGRCTILFDACMVVVIKGQEQGAMDDFGIRKGMVYTTYEGIVNAQNWSSASKESLRSYFNKNVEGLFVKLMLGKGTGISEVYGMGTYCYGTYVTIDCFSIDGYTFQKWIGTYHFNEKSPGFFLSQDTILFALATEDTLQVVFHYGVEENMPEEIQLFSFHARGQSFITPKWEMQGYHLAGWTCQDSKEEVYPLAYEPDEHWIQEKYPTVHLVAVWEPNQYRIEFDANGGEGEMDSMSGFYHQEIELPKNLFWKEYYAFESWSISSEYSISKYRENQMVAISELANLAGVQNQTNQIITLTALWEGLPSIMVQDLYFTLDEAKEGLITEAVLAKGATAYDPEDGYLPYCTGNSSCFYMEDYRSEDYTNLEDSAELTQFFTAVDKDGNQNYRQMRVVIVNTLPRPSGYLTGKIRFISQKYFEDNDGNPVPSDEGGLSEHSCWIRDEEYRNLLRRVLENG